MDKGSHRISDQNCLIRISFLKTASSRVHMARRLHYFLTQVHSKILAGGRVREGTYARWEASFTGISTAACSGAASCCCTVEKVSGWTAAAASSAAMCLRCAARRRTTITATTANMATRAPAAAPAPIATCEGDADADEIESDVAAADMPAASKDAVSDWAPLASPFPPSRRPGGGGVRVVVLGVMRGAWGAGEG